MTRKSSNEKRSLPQVFARLKAMLKRHSAGLTETAIVYGSKVPLKKHAFHLYGKKMVSVVEGQKPKPTYVCGIILQKHFVGFYSMPIYSHPKLVAGMSPELKKMLKGKSCINVTRLEPSLEKEIESLVVEGMKVYRKLGWI